MATEVKKGITIEFRGDTVEFDNSLDNINRALRLLQAENARINRSLKFDPNNVELLEQKFKNLQTAERLANERLNNYKVALIDTIDKEAEITKSAKWKELATKISGCEQKANEYAKQLAEVQDENGHITDVTKWKTLRAEQAQNAEELFSLYDEMVKLAQSNDAITNPEKWLNLVSQIIKAESEVANLETQSDNTSKKIAQITGQDTLYNLEMFKEKVYETGRAFSNLGQILAPISTLAQTALTKTAEKAINFEESFAGVKKTVDASAETLEIVSKQFRELAKEIPLSTTEINKVGEMAGQLGVEAKNLGVFTETMLKLGSSTNLLAEDASTAIARIFNVVSGNVNDNISSVSRFGSALVALGNNAAATESEILDMTTRLASAGAIYNVSEADLLALGTAMASVGLKAEAGGSSVATIMNNIEKLVASNSDKLETWAELVGTSTEQFSSAWRNNALGTLTEVIRALASAKGEGESVASMLGELGITSIRQTDTMLRLTSAVDLLDGYIDLSNQAWDENIALNDEASKRYDTTESKLTLLKNSFEDLMITIGDKILPIIRPFIDKLTEFIDKIGSKGDLINNFALGFTALVGALAPISSGIGSGLTKFSGFIDKLSHVGENAKTASGGLKDVYDKLGSLVKVPYEEINNKMLNTGTVFIDTIGKIINKIGESDEKRISVTDNLRELFKKIPTVISSVWKSIGDFFTKMISGLGNLYMKLVTNPFASVIAIIVLMIATFVHAYETSEEFREKISYLWESLKAYLIPIVEMVVDTFKKFWEELKTNLNPLIDATYQLFQDLWVAIGEVVVMIAKLIFNIMKELKPVFDWLMPILADIASVIIGTIVEAIRLVISTIKSVIDWVKSAIGWFYDLLGMEDRYAKTSSYVTGHDYEAGNLGGGRVSVLDYYPDSGGLGLNYGLAGGGMGGTINLHTDLIVNNSGEVINEATVRRWGKVITDVVSDELGKRI